MTEQVSKVSEHEMSTVDEQERNYFKNKLIFVSYNSNNITYTFISIQ